MEPKDNVSKTNFKTTTPNLLLEKERRDHNLHSLRSRWIEDEVKQKLMFAESRNLFDYDDLLNSASIPIKIAFPELEFFVLYCPLTSGERNECKKIKHVDRAIQVDMQNRKYVSLMLQKANPEVPNMAAKVDKFPATWVDAIIMKIGEKDNRFLLPLLNNAVRGLDKIRRHKENY